MGYQHNQPRRAHNEKYHLTDEIRAVLEHEYTGKRGEIKALAERFQIPRYTMGYWVWSIRSIREQKSKTGYRHWTDAEVAYLLKHEEWMSDKAIAVHLRRPVTAIWSKRYDMRRANGEAEE